MMMMLKRIVLQIMILMMNAGEGDGGHENNYGE